MNAVLSTKSSTIHMNVKTLQRALAVLGKIVPNSPKLPVMECVVFMDGNIHANDFDRELVWRGTFDRDFAALVPLKKLAAALKSAKPGDTVTLVTEGETYTVTSEDPDVSPYPAERPILTVSHDRGSSQIICRELEEYNTFPRGDSLGSRTIHSNLAEDLSDAVKFASADETRYILNGVFLSREGAIVATDGRRLLKIPSGDIASLPRSVIVPAATAKLFSLKALQERPCSVELFAHVASDSNPENAEAKSAQIILGDGEWTIVTTLVEGNFPNYKQVIPKSPGNWIGFLRKADAEKISAFLKSAPKCGKEGSVAVKITADGNAKSLRLDAGSEITGRSSVTINGIMTPSHETVEIAFNAPYLLGALAAGCLTWAFRDELSTMVATGEDQRLAVVMPLRLS